MASFVPWSLDLPGTSSCGGLRMSWSDDASATSYVHLSLILSLPPSSAQTLDLCCSLIPSLALSPPALSSITRMDPRYFSLCAASGTVDSSGCLMQMLQKLVREGTTWAGVVLGFYLVHSCGTGPLLLLFDTVIQESNLPNNPFTFVLGWSSLTSQISDLGDGVKTIRRKKLQNIWVLLLFSSAWILITCDCRMPCCQIAAQGCGTVLARSLFVWYCSGYISSNSIFKKYFEWEKFSANDCMYIWYSRWHRGQISSPVIEERTAGREKWGTLS